MTVILLQKRLGSLYPADIEAKEALQKFPQGEFLRVKLSRPRNLAHHRLFFALLHIVFDNQEHYKQFDHMLTALKVALGHCDTVICKDGKVAYLPRSISFAAMDQTAFDKFFNRTCDLLAERFLSGVSADELKREVAGMIGAD